MALRAKINGLALCAGIGGLELGVRRAVRDYRTVCYVEQDPYAAGVLAARMDEKAICQAPIWDDLESFDGRRWRGVVDLVSAGFPCQPFSVAGKREGANDKRHVWPIIKSIIQDVCPSHVFIENVPGFIQLGLEETLRDLAEMGFDASWCCVAAAQVGARHLRERFFLLANAHGSGLADFQRSEAAKERKRIGTPLRSGWWDVEPDVGRVANGIPSRVDRLRCLGNAVVPAQAELALKILMERL